MTGPVLAGPGITGSGIEANRSWLYVPADRPDRAGKALAAGADAVIFDLEDAVAAPNKAAARTALAATLAALEPGRDGPSRWVRINNDSAHLDADLAVAINPVVTGVIVPKAEDPVAMGAVVARIRSLDRHRAIAIVGLIESARGVLDARAILAVEGVDGLALGEADLSADLGVPFTDNSPALMHLRVLLVTACAAMGAAPPIGPVTVNFRDVEAYAASCDDLAAVGFTSRQIIHPDQISAAHAAFTPAEADVAHARELVDGFERAAADGVGVYLGTNGRMVDLAVVRSARRLLTRAIR